MAKLEGINKVLVIGSGPIIIGQAAEFDYSGTQGIESLKEEGVEVILINSNPATIMTDSEICSKIYMEPLTREYVEKIIYQEKPDGILPTLGGQTALNLAMELEAAGVLNKQGVKLLGTNSETIRKSEDREEFKKLMAQIGEPTPESKTVCNIDEALEFCQEIGFPIIIRPAFTLGGAGGGIADNLDSFMEIVKSGLQASPITQVLLERSIAGFKEIEYEVLRDKNDNTIIVCNMENIDPVGIHTGDSIVVAPSQTLSDREHQMLRSASIKIIRALKIEGGCNVQLAIDPDSYRYYIIEVNPRVSRSSALASKATGYPIAKVAAKIALGMTLDEIINPITKTTYASFEPSLDYLVTKFPRWPFDKFTKASKKLGTQMKATGEVMSIGRNFEESLLKSIRSLEVEWDYIETDEPDRLSNKELIQKIKAQDSERIFYIGDALRRGITVEQIHEITKIDFFFLNKIQNIINQEQEIKKRGFNHDIISRAKSFGISDNKIAQLLDSTAENVYSFRQEHKILPVYKMVDTCSGEFESSTPYYYSTYETEDEIIKDESKKRFIVLGSGPIRIGQGVEFDYATVHAVKTIKRLGHEAIVINNNPETVSTDFNISDRLYFEPLHIEDVLHVIDHEKPDGVIVQFGGQTAINLANPLSAHGVNIIGTSLENLDKAEDREKFENLLKEMDIARPLGFTAKSREDCIQKALQIGFPVMVRPSYVLGGRAMEIVYTEKELEGYLDEAVSISSDYHILVDRYVIGREVDVDAICDGKNVYIPGIMEHIERAGVHSGDSIAVYPPQTLSKEVKDKIINITKNLTMALNIQGLVNLQFIVKNKEVYVIEVNPRSSRTVPFLSKVTGIPMARLATEVILGKKLSDYEFEGDYHPEADYVSVKTPVFSFTKLIDVEISLGPEMKSTGEAIGREPVFAKALYKGLLASGMKIPTQGVLLATIADKHKEHASKVIEKYCRLGFQCVATKGTAEFLKTKGIDALSVNKIDEGPDNLLTLIKENKVDLILNTMSNGKNVTSDGFQLRRASVENDILCLTSIDTADALADALSLIGFQSSPMQSTVLEQL